MEGGGTMMGMRGLMGGGGADARLYSTTRRPQRGGGHDEEASREAHGRGSSSPGVEGGVGAIRILGHWAQDRVPPGLGLGD